MSRPWKPGTGQWALKLEGINPPPGKKRRPRVYLYTEATDDGAFILRTPDLEDVSDLMRSLGVFGYWSRIYNGLIIRAKHLRDLVAAVQSKGWYVRVRPYEEAVA